MGNDSFVYGCRSVFQLDLDTIKFWIFDYHINHFYVHQFYSTTCIMYFLQSLKLYTTSSPVLVSV